MKGMRIWGTSSDHPQSWAFGPRHILGAVCAGILATSLGTLAACGGSPESRQPATTGQAVSAASVSIVLFDANGARVGEGSGVMIAPNLVLTSGHLISGKHRWLVTSADGKQQATGSRGMTYDWMTYDSNKAHPRKHDVGVIHLDAPIKLATYPKLVSEWSGDGTKATRIRGNGATFAQLDISLGKVRSSPNAWLGDAVPGETLDTGGAVYHERGILGIVSGRGMTTGKLYVARIDKLVKWLAPKIACAGGAMAVRTYAAPGTDKSVPELCEDAGAGTGTTSSSGGSNGSDGTSGGPGGGDDSGGTCEGNDDGVCYGNCGAGGSNGSSGTNGSSGPNGSTGPGGDGTPGSSGGPGSDTGSSSGNNGSSGPGGDGTPGSSGAPSSDGSSGNSGSSNPGGDSTPGSSGAPSSDGSSGNNGNSGTNGNTSSSSGGGAGGSQGTVPGEGEACQGPTDNPDLCPPEPDGCVGPNCGGGQPDDSIDYGNCACGSSGSGGIYLR